MFDLPTHGCALVTGASRGIGLAIARVLAGAGPYGAGMPVALNYRSDRSGALEAARSIEKAGGVAVAVCADVTSAQDVDAVFDRLEAEFGLVSVLVNNAGVRADGLAAALSDTEWGDVLATNLTGCFHTMRRAVPPMLRARHGRIVTVTSVLGHRSLPGVANYAAAKGGVEALTRTVAVEVARKGVTVNAVAPGPVRTGMTDGVGHLDSTIHNGVPMRRAATPDEVAACVRFLASSAASYVTGTTLTVDGGLSASSVPIR
jgi:3-oxoacyl-[acyl-carrier protein] reductase